MLQGALSLKKKKKKIDKDCTCFASRRERIDAWADGQREAKGPSRQWLGIAEENSHNLACRHSPGGHLCSPGRKAGEWLVPSALKYLASLQGMELGNREVGLFLFIILAIS